jgi:hypothetical protein
MCMWWTPWVKWFIYHLKWKICRKIIYRIELYSLIIVLYGSIIQKNGSIIKA